MRNKEGLRPHKQWKSRWKQQVKYDHDWDGLFLLQLIVHKIKLLQKYYTPQHTFLGEDDLKRIQQQLQEVAELGDRLLKDEYSVTASEYLTQHNLYTATVKVAVRGEKGALKRFCAPVGDKDPHDTIRKQIVSYQKENHLKEKHCEISYTSEWDNPCSHDQWLALLQDANIKKEKDKQQFFNKIAEYYEYWWD